jgi:hypothetical protein
MKPPRRRLTLRALIGVIALFAVDFGGIAWFIHHEPRGPRVGSLVMRGEVEVRVDPLPEFIAPIVFFGPFVLLFVLIYHYVPPRLDEVLTVILILILFVILIVPALRHS